MMLVFSFQGLGQIAAPLSVVILDAILPTAPQVSWRITLLIGAIPSAFAIPIALSLYSKPRLTSRLSRGSIGESIGGSPSQDSAVEVVSSRGGRPSCSKRNMILLLGTAGTWFIFDIVFYGNVIFTPFILEKVFNVDQFHPNKLAIAGYSVIIYICALPGMYLSSYVSDSWGRKRLQIFGFSMCTILFAVLSLRLEVLSVNLLFVIYLLTFFFYNFGPNSTTFCLPAETFNSRDRTFYNGVSAAFGKAGAVVGASLFKYILDEFGLDYVVSSCAWVCAFGAALTVVAVVDRRGQGLDYDDQDLRLSLGDNNHHETREVSELELT